MYIRRDGSVQGPLWPREIRDIVTSKFFEVCNLQCRMNYLMVTRYIFSGFWLKAHFVCTNYLQFIPENGKGSTMLMFDNA